MLGKFLSDSLWHLKNVMTSRDQDSCSCCPLTARQQCMMGTNGILFILKPLSVLLISPGLYRFPIDSWSVFCVEPQLWNSCWMKWEHCAADLMIYRHYDITVVICLHDMQPFLWPHSNRKWVFLWLTVGNCPSMFSDSGPTSSQDVHLWPVLQSHNRATPACQPIRFIQLQRRPIRVRSTVSSAAAHQESGQWTG